MTYTLFIRDTNDSDTFVAHRPSFTSYREAGLVGQQLVGPGQWYVECGNHTPSEAEQMLQPIYAKRNKNKTQQRLNDL